MAVVISNDSDLVESEKIVIQEMNLPVIVVSPFERNTIELKKIATLCKQIRNGVLQASQFDPVLTDTVGEITRPAQW